MHFFRQLSVTFRRRPILIASTQTGILMFSGDLICQKFVEKKRTTEIDLIRAGRFGLVGFFILGPLLRTWYGFLDRRIVLKTPATSTIAKVAADQFLFAPVFLFNFMGLMGVMNGRSWESIKSELSSNYKDVLTRNYQLWPAVQMVNFWVVPLEHRVLVVQIVALFWNVYLSFKTNR